MGENQGWSGEVRLYFDRLERGAKAFGLGYSFSLYRGMLNLNLKHEKTHYDVSLHYYWSDGLYLTVQSPRYMDHEMWKSIDHQSAYYWGIAKEMPPHLRGLDAFLPKSFEKASTDERLRMVDGFCGFADFLLNDLEFQRYVAQFERPWGQQPSPEFSDFEESMLRGVKFLTQFAENHQYSFSFGTDDVGTLSFVLESPENGHRTTLSYHRRDGYWLTYRFGFAFNLLGRYRSEIDFEELKQVLPEEFKGLGDSVTSANHARRSDRMDIYIQQWCEGAHLFFSDGWMTRFSEANR